MRTIITSILFALAFACAGQEMEKDPADGCPIFKMEEGDTVYVMKQYYMVFYKKGYHREQGESETALIQEGHMAHIKKLGEEGVLSIAGPFGDDGDFRGILILNIPDLEKAKEIMEEDPAVKADRLSYEIHPWWGAKGSTLK